LFRHTPTLEPWQGALIRCDLHESTKWARYSWLELPLQALDGLVNRIVMRRRRRGWDVYVFRRLGDVWSRGVICSKTSNRALIRSCLLPYILEYGSPGDTYRWMRSHTESWTVLGKSAHWGPL
jgi:hypothetical protein